VTRPKFETRKIRLIGQQQLQNALALLPNLPLDATKPLELVIREEVKARKLDQNGYYWLRLGEIAAHAWFHGRQFSADVWHEFMKREVMPEEITTKDGVVRSKWEVMPNGDRTPISTTLLERGCFAEYTTAVEAFGAGLGVEYSANPNEAWRAA
jgi:hypothetical protein